MHPKWHAFLTDRTATIEANGVTHFGDPATELAAVEQETIICDLSHRGLLHIAGEDAAEFLQGQLTNDVEQLLENNSHLSAYCDHKGRILALFRMWRSGDSFHLELPQELVEATIKRLTMFLLRSQATIEDHSSEAVRLGVAGAQAKTLLEVHYSLPDKENRYVEKGPVRVTRLPGEEQRYEIHAPVDTAIELWRSLADNTHPVGRGVWTLLDIRSVTPEVYPLTRELFTPQMLNLEVIDGVSFNKGCYTGQEVVARTQFLGKIKRRTYAAKLDCDTPPEPGTELTGTQATAGQAAGRIVTACPSPGGGCEVLAMVQTSARDNETLRLGGVDGPMLEFSDPPYSLEQIRPGSQ